MQRGRSFFNSPRGTAPAAFRKCAGGTYLEEGIKGEFSFPSLKRPCAGGARPFSRKGPGPKGAEGGIPPFCTFPRCRSVKKMCQWHIFSVGRSGHAARREPWVTVPLCPQMFPCPIRGPRRPRRGNGAPLHLVGATLVVARVYASPLSFCPPFTTLTDEKDLPD